jgi:hypothetical protein
MAAFPRAYGSTPAIASTVTRLGIQIYKGKRMA